MKNINSIIIGATAVIALASCKPKITEPKATLGSVDATTYVAVGNSITSGYADGALYYDGQIVSFPALISEQLNRAGQSNNPFRQPLMPSGSNGVGASKNSKFILSYATDCLGATSLMPVPASAYGDTSAFYSNIYSAQGPFNNMGVPGAKVITAHFHGYGNPANGTGNFNPFFTRMAKDPSSSSIIGDAMDLNPTFFTLFLGNNDVLTYASNGGASDFITPSSGGIGVGFDATITSIVDTLTKNGAKGAIANIPDITALPYFTTVPWNGLTLERQGQADSLNAVMPFFGINYVFKVGNNPFVIYDASLSTVFKGRVMEEGELVLLSVPLDSIKCHGMGTFKPIPDVYVLTTQEIASIKAAVSAFNSTIYSLAQTKGLAFVDVNAFMQSAQKGIVYNGITINTQFVTGGAFSLDGIHLNPIGNAMLANEFLKSINSTYNATIPLVDPTKYRGCIFP